MKRIVSFILTFALTASACPSALAVNEAASPISTKDGFLDVEIENMPYNGDFFRIRESDMFSGGKALEPMSEDKTIPQASEEAQLDLSFKADKGGTYSVWIRHTGEIVNQRGQSVFVSIGGASYTNFRLTGEPSDPVWLKIGSLSVKEGNVGSVRLIRRQNAYISFDRCIITKDDSYIPDDVALGIRKEQTPPKSFAAKGGVCDIEAEDITVYSIFDKTSSFKMSGGSGIFNNGAASASNVSSNPANAGFSVKCDESGTYYLWGYVRGNASSNVILISVNGSGYDSVTVGNTNGKFEWMKLRTISSVEKGASINVRIRANRGTVNLDKFCLVNDILKQPYGLLGKLIEKDTTVTNPYSDPGIELPAGHPRVYIKEGDIERILEDREKGDNVAAWKMQQMNLEEGLSESFTGRLPSPEAGKSNDRGSITACIEALAFDYLINKNKESGEKAISALNNYLNTVVFVGAYGDDYVRPAGQLIFHVAEVYDWCYDLLDKNTKEYFIERTIEIAKDGLEVKWPFDGSGVSGHTAEAQLQRDLLAFSIAVGDERPDIFDRMMGVMYNNYVPQRTRIYEALMPNNGSQYGCYRGRWELLATILMDKIGVPNLYGENQHYYPYWYLYARRPDGLIMRDGDARTDGNEVGAFMTRNDMTRVMLLSSYYFGDEYIKEEFNRDFGLSKSFSDGHDGMSPVEFLCFYDADLGTKSSSELPLTRYFPSPKGAMFARTGFHDGLESDDVVAFMNLEEYNFSNHDHLDAGHFQIYYKGILANDAGTYGSYGSAHDRGYYKRSVAHNTMAVRNPSSPVTFQGYTTYDGGQRSGNEGADGGANIFETDEYRFGEILGHEFGEDKQEPDYSYLSGNLRRAYKSDTVENYERSFMFYNLKDKDHPAAMIVFDRITSASASYQKAWLLNGPTVPQVDGNRTVFVNDENGYNGKMTVDTLLPKEIETVTIGGEGQEAYAAGVNYSADVTLNPNLTHEAQGYRIEISPKQASAKDFFLNVIQVGDADGTEKAFEPVLIQNTGCVGAILDNTVTMFKADYGRSDKPVTFTLPNGDYKIAVCDNIAGEWSVTKDGGEILTLSATEEGGVLYFAGGGGTYSVSYKGALSESEITETVEAAETVEEQQETQTDIGTRVYGSYVYSKTLGKEYDGNPYVPLRAVSEKLGATVSWEDGAAVVRYGNKTLAVRSGSDEISVNGIAEKLAYPTMNIDGTILVSPQFFSGYLNCEWQYDSVVKICRFRSYIIGTSSDADGEFYFEQKHNEIPGALTVCAVLQSGSEGGIGGNDITKVLDGDFDSRWAVQGTKRDPSFGILDFGSVKELDKLYLAYYQGASRKSYFSIEVSEDGGNFVPVIENGESSGDTDEFNVFDLGGVRARYLKIYGLGNNSSSSAPWNSITELVVSGK